MKFYFVMVFFLHLCTLRLTQINCYQYLKDNNRQRHQACIELKNTSKFYEMDVEYQQIVEKAIKIDSGYYLPYILRSQLYLNKGNMILWKKYIDKAVALDATNSLKYRIWGRFNTFKDYQGAITDIQDYFKINTNAEDWIALNNNYDLRILEALCFKELRQYEKSLKLFEKFMTQKSYLPKKFDMLHLGVLYYELEMNDEALSALHYHEMYNNSAETQYYLALVYFAINNDIAKHYIEKAFRMYHKGQNMEKHDGASIDKVFLPDLHKLHSKIAMKF